MNAASKIAEDLLQAYKHILEVRENFKNNKLQALKRQNPKYKLFDFEHPYYDNKESLDVAVKHFRQMIKSMIDVEIDGSTLRSEWGKVQMFAILSNKPVDALMEKLLLTKQKQ